MLATFVFTPSAVNRSKSYTRSDTSLATANRNDIRLVFAWDNISLVEKAASVVAMSIERLTGIALKAPFTTFEGDNTVLMQLAAKNFLAELKELLFEPRKRASRGN